jgi:hypothetical protein
LVHVGARKGVNTGVEYVPHFQSVLTEEQSLDDQGRVRARAIEKLRAGIYRAFHIGTRSVKYDYYLDSLKNFDGNRIIIYNCFEQKLRVEWSRGE